MITMPAPDEQAPKRASLLQVVKTVASAFFGVRRRADHDAVKITPAQVIIVGLIGAALFVISLVLLVSFVLSRVGAGA